MKNNTTDTARERPAQQGGGSSAQASRSNGTGWPASLSDRSVYPTAIGPVCMSKAEHAAYLEELERRGISTSER